ETNDSRDGLRQPIPVRTLAGEPLSASARQRVELGPPVVLRGAPFGRNPAVVLELVQRGIERSVAYLQHLVGDLPQALANCPAMERFEGEDLQQQQVEGALDQIWRSAHVFTRLPRGYRHSSR